MERSSVKRMTSPSVSATAPDWRVLSDDGGYCWFESPRALVHGTELVIGTVANGGLDPSRRGDVELIVHDLASRQTRIVELHHALEADDHDSPALLVRPDGRLLALYAKHNAENLIYYRISEPDTALVWSAEASFVPSPSTRVTYANLQRLSAEADRIYDFYRGLDASFKPSYAFSDDGGASWQSGNVFIDVPSQVRHRPYVAYASNGVDAIHFLYTDGHPRDLDNGLHHMFYRGGMLFRSDGTPIRALSAGLRAPEEGTTISQADAQNVPWTIALELDAAGRPHALYSVQVGSAGLPVGQGGDDIRYRMAHFDGQAWHDAALAFGGSRLYAGEDDYSGLVAFDPDDLFTVYLSANADPALGTPLISAADGRRHHELFVATSDRGQSWSFTALTRDSSFDRLRPMVVRAPDGQKILISLCGTYSSFRSYQQRVIGLFFRGSLLDALAAGNLPPAP